MAVISRACSRVLVLLLVSSVTIAGKSWGWAEISFLAYSSVLPLAVGARLSVPVIRG